MPMFDRDDPTPEGMFPVPEGVYFRVMFCGSCPNAHIIIYDENKIPFCQFALSASDCDRVAREIRARDPNFRELKADPPHA